MRSTSTRNPESLSFDDAIDMPSITAAYRAMRRRRILVRGMTAALLAAGIATAGFPLALQWQSDMQITGTVDTAARRAADWPYPNAQEAIRKARAYNASLASSGQPILGEAADPFATVQGNAKASKDDSAASHDTEYQSLLDSGAGMMGSIRIPEISVKLPIYHGTSEKALASGAGHLYGTSLPVGGKSTHAVITGHRGLVSALMFTRLDEMKQGDFFYIEVMNETLGYEVDSISVIDPSDVSRLTIRKGEDRVTLMTCTPYGINTQRLLVSGHRVSIPDPAPDPSDLHDARNIAIATAGVTMLCGFAPIAATRVRKARKTVWARHSSGSML